MALNRNIGEPTGGSGCLRHTIAIRNEPRAVCRRHQTLVNSKVSAISRKIIDYSPCLAMVLCGRPAPFGFPKVRCDERALESMPMVNVPAGVVVAPSSPVGMKLVAVMLSRYSQLRLARIWIACLRIETYPSIITRQPGMPGAAHRDGPVIGVDVGGSKVAAGVVDRDGRILSQVRAAMAARGLPAEG